SRGQNRRPLDPSAAGALGQVEGRGGKDLLGEFEGGGGQKFIAQGEVVVFLIGVEANGGLIGTDGFVVKVLSLVNVSQQVMQVRAGLPANGCLCEIPCFV